MKKGIHILLSVLGFYIVLCSAEHRPRTYDVGNGVLMRRDRRGRNWIEPRCRCREFRCDYSQDETAIGPCWSADGRSCRARDQYTGMCWKSWRCTYWRGCWFPRGVSRYVRCCRLPVV